MFLVGTLFQSLKKVLDPKCPYETIYSSIVRFTEDPSISQSRLIERHNPVLFNISLQMLIFWDFQSACQRLFLSLSLSRCSYHNART